MLDIPSVSAIAHEAKVPLLVDATFTTPVLMKPFELGADLLYHSATKFLGGHGVAIAGVLVDSGRFDWEASGKFETLTAPYAGFHGMDFEEESGTRAFLLRARREGLRDFGACMAPMTAFQILQGIETLHLRMPRHVENTRKVVAFLSRHAAVEKVIYPELPDHPDHALAKKLLPQRLRRGVLVRDQGRPRRAGKRFIESLRVFSHLANVGDAKSLVIHPATTTHYRMSDEDLKKAGITAGTVRLSIGLEDPQDLIDDLERALKRLAEVNFEVGGQARVSPIPPRTSSTRRSPRWCSCTARASTIPRSACRAATSATTAATCWRSTFPATAAAKGRRSPTSGRWRTGSPRF